jgi:hypothetical protein
MVQQSRADQGTSFNDVEVLSLIHGHDLINLRCGRKPFEMVTYSTIVRAREDFFAQRNINL